VAYWDREHHRFPEPQCRIVRSLRTRNSEQAAVRAGALNTLMERGDWPVLKRFAEGLVDIETIVAAVRDGEWKRLRQVNADGVALGAAADAYLAHVEARGESKRTVRNYTSIIRRGVRHYGATTAMHAVSTTEAQAYLDGAERSPRTKLAVKVAMGALWKYAMEAEAEAAEAANALPTIAVNPWRRTKLAKLRRTRFSFLNQAEARALLAHEAVRETRVDAFLAVALYAGLRLQEITHLRTDIDVVLTDKPSTSWIVVQSREGEHKWQPKTERGERKLRTIPALYERLVRHRRDYAGERYFFRPERDDVPPHPSTVTTWVQTAFRAAGIRYGRSGEALTLHSMRHTYATWQVAAGIPIPTVARRLGDTAAMVLEVYSHAMPEQDEQADDVLQAAAEGGK
jgi:integrase